MEPRHGWIFPGAVVLAAVLVLGSPVRAERDLAADAILRELAEAERDPAALRDRVEEVVDDLRKSGRAVTSGSVTYCSPEPFAVRANRSQAVQDAVLRGAAALKAAGFKPGGEVSPLVVIQVTSKQGNPIVVATDDGRAVLVRTAPGVARKDKGLPRLVRRVDGLPTVRDAEQTAEAVRVALFDRSRGTASTRGPGSLSHALARHLLRWSGASVKVPRWLLLGGLDWLEDSHALSTGSDGGHVCGGSADVKTAVAKFVDGGEKKATLAERRLLGGVVAFLATVPGRLPTGWDRLGEQGSTSSDGFAKAFDASADGAFGEAAKAAAAAEAGCVDQSVVCTICDGKKKLKLQCADCLGTNALKCPSCLGSNDCSNCSDGWMYYEGGKKSRCKLCGGKGTKKCMACAGLGKAECKACKSSKIERPCPLCTDGKIPCPQAGPRPQIDEICAQSGGAPCPWCEKGAIRVACSTCDGASYTGCRNCRGTMRRRCGECNGTGKRRMVFTDGTTASSTSCKACSGKGTFKCRKCVRGKVKCVTCGAKGGEKLNADKCGLCDDGQLPDVEATRKRIALRLSPSGVEDVTAVGESIDQAVKFLFRCRDPQSGAFSLRKFRKRGSSVAGKLYEDAGLLSNAQCIWALAATGIDKNDPRMKKPWQALKQQCGAIVSGQEKAYVQHTAMGLRALLGGGEPADSDLVDGLVQILVKSQRSDGLWNHEIDRKLPADPLDALFAVESLWIAQRAGAKVPSMTWIKALKGGRSGFSGGKVALKKKGFFSASTVASNTALVVLAKAGMLGDKAALFDFEEMDEIKAGLAWLDRFIDIRSEPRFQNGARRTGDEDAGYSAYLFAIQRLAMLLSIEVLGGERWHATGARHLLSIQLLDGSFEETGKRRVNGPVRATTIAIAFLVRATPPISRATK